MEIEKLSKEMTTRKDEIEADIQVVVSRLLKVTALTVNRHMSLIDMTKVKLTAPCTKTN